MTEQLHFETIEMIAATIAHEVKNPLALIQANINYIELEDKKGQYSKNCCLMKAEVAKTNQLVSDLVNLLYDTYRFDEEVEIFDVITDAVDTNETIHKSIIFAIDCPNKNLYFSGNRKLFSYVLSNVIKNSVESVGVNGKIVVSCDDNDGDITLKVMDNGQGICLDDIEKIDNNQIFTTKKTGSGIGINICKSIIKEHNGSFTIANMDKGGCVVTICLPKG